MATPPRSTMATRRGGGALRSAGTTDLVLDVAVLEVRDRGDRGDAQERLVPRQPVTTAVVRSARAGGVELAQGHVAEVEHAAAVRGGLDVDLQGLAERKGALAVVAVGQEGLELLAVDDRGRHAAHVLEREDRAHLRVTPLEHLDAVSERVDVGLRGHECVGRGGARGGEDQRERTCHVHGGLLPRRDDFPKEGQRKLTNYPPIFH